jgi:pimeloyl-ACP methyl ester carboxylesterase
MQTADVNGIRVRYDERGSGEPVLLIHGGLFVDTFACFFAEPAMSGYRLVRYSRRGLGGSTRTDTPSTMVDQAADAVGLLDHLGIEKAHVVAHSAGGAVALQLASQAPGRVHSLSLLEPGMPSILANEHTLGYLAECAAKAETDPAGAVEQFFVMVLGKQGSEVLEARAPGSMAQGVADADVMFTDEASALLGWTFGPEEAATVTQPAVYVLGSESDATVLETVPTPFFGPARDLLAELLPQMEVTVLDGLNHLLQIQDPAMVANAVGEFLQRHPMTPST